MQRKSKGADRKIERNIEARSDGYSFRVRMKIGQTFINETFFSIDEARAYRDLLRAGKATDKEQEKVLRAKAEKKKAAHLTVDSLLERYAAEVTPTKKGRKEEAYAIGRLRRMKAFSNLPVYLVNGETIERLKRDLTDCRLSDTTIRKYLMIVSHVFKVAISRRWCAELDNPVKAVELPKARRMRSRRFEQEELEYLSVELAKSKNSLVLSFFEFAIETACRRGEVLRLRIRDVDLNKRTAVLIDTKNGEDRIIGLSSRAVAIVEPLISAPIENVVPIASKKSERKLFPLSVSTLRHAFERAKDRAKLAYESDCRTCGKEARAGFLENLRLHDCRREATSRMFEKGLDVMEVSAMTGHKTLAMLRGYTHLRASELAKKLG
jgi:integrase